MISKFAKQSEVGDMVVAELDRVWTEEFAPLKDAPVVKTASQEKVVESVEKNTTTALADLTADLVKIAEQLEAVNHPAVAKVDEVLEFISTEVLA